MAKGMSATKSPTDCRRSAERYGAAKARRTAAGSDGRDRAVAAVTKAGVRTVTAWRRKRVLASRMMTGPPIIGGLCDRRVREDDAAELVTMGERPSQRDDAAPVVPHCYHGSSDAESRREVAKVVHPLRQRPR